MWDWERPTIKGTDGIYSYIPELPAREWYHLLVTWDAARGILNYFVNGTPMRVPGTVVTPWKLEPQTEVTLSADGFSVAELRLEPECLTAQQALERVPPAFRGRGAALFGAGPVPLSASLDSRKGRLLYESKLASPAQIGGWVMEGPGVLKFADGWLEMSSQMVDGKPKGHIVHWCPRDFPDRFVAEWECQVTSEFGLNIIFFAAKGVGGEDIFDPKLPPRNGTFRQYTSEAIVSYHISYYADTPDTPGRSTSNLRKNNHFYLVANGPPGIPAGSNRVHSIRLIKDGAHVQCQVDGRVIIDYTDDGKRYGPVHGGGKIGFRQMQWSVTRYRNFRVWVLAR